MLLYLSFSYEGSLASPQAEVIVDRYQALDMDNCYLCPILSFPHAKKYTPEQRMLLRLDLLSDCDALLLLGELDDEMRQELEFANLVGMEVRYLEEEGAGSKDSHL